jgi:stress-induced morphogen
MSPEQMIERLKTHFPDAQIEVFDLTGTQNHYEVAIESGAFKGQSRIQQHQAVMGAFSAELKTGEVHALSIKTKTKEA